MSLHLKSYLGALVIFLSSIAKAQCPEWLPGDGVAGTNLFVACTTLWDQDGAGPLTPRVALGGRFDVAGNAVASNIALWDPTTNEWSTPGSGVAGLAIISAVGVGPGNRLIIGGDFSEVGGVPANAIAEFDGVNWHAMGDGLQGGQQGPATVSSIIRLANGNVAVVGDFLVAGSVIANGVAVWDGANWSALGGGIGDALGYPPVKALAQLQNGNLVAAGDFASAGGQPRSNIARWDGSTWQDMAGGMDFGVNALAVAPNGNLIATGVFLTAGGVAANRVARWDSSGASPGSAWAALGNGLTEFNDEFFGNAVTVMPNGDAIVTGNSYVREHPLPHAHGIARWNGSTWSEIGGGLRDVYDNGIFGTTLLQLTNGDLIVGGQFNRAGGPTGAGAANIARWNGSTWSALATGFNDWLIAARQTSNGDLIGCGAFSTAGPGPATSCIARWNGSTWIPLTSPGLMGFVNDAIELSNGDILAAGGFWLPGQDATADPQNGLAIFDGTAWTTAGVYMPDAYCYSLVRLPNGNIAAGGIFSQVDEILANNVAIWNGVSWSEPDGGIGDPGEVVLGLAVDGNGDLLAGGVFQQAGGSPASNIARYTVATGWTALGSGIDDVAGAVFAMAVDAAGDIYAAGFFASPGNGIARWDGTAWNSLGNGIDNGGAAYAITVDANDNVVLGGQFTSVDGVPASNIARWDGSSWSAFGAGLDGGFSDYSVVYGLTTRNTGEIVAVGQFNRAGGQTCVNFARWGCDACPGDTNGDNTVDINDLAALLAHFGTTSGATLAEGDMDSDGDVELVDLAILLARFGTSC